LVVVIVEFRPAVIARQARQLRRKYGENLCLERKCRGPNFFCAGSLRAHADAGWKIKFVLISKILFLREIRRANNMYWTLELASYLEDAPWPATKDELIDYSIRSGAPLEVVENLQELEDDGQPYESIEEIWPDYPTKEDFFFNEDEY
jgi:hypothetical protein